MSRYRKRSLLWNPRGDATEMWLRLRHMFFADADVAQSISGWQNGNWASVISFIQNCGPAIIFLCFLKVPNGQQVVRMQETYNKI